MGTVELPLRMRPEEMTGEMPVVRSAAPSLSAQPQAPTPQPSAADVRAFGGAIGLPAPVQVGQHQGPSIGYQPRPAVEQGAPQLPQERPLQVIRQGITPAHWEQQGASLRGTPGQMQAVADLQESGQQAQASHAAAQTAALEYAQQQAQAADMADVAARKQNELVDSAQRARIADQDARLDDIKASIDKHNALAAPDPAKFWQGLGFAGSIGMIAAGFADKLGSAMGHYQPSNVIENAIDRSLRAQQAEIDKSRTNIEEQKGLYAQFRSAGLDKEAAAQATKARRLEDASAIVASIARQASIPQKRAELEQQAVALKEKAAQQRLELSKILPGEGMGVMKAASGGGIDYQAMKFQNEMMNDAVKRQHTRAQTAGELAKAEKAGDEHVAELAKEKAKFADVKMTAERMKRLGAPTLWENAVWGMPVIGNALGPVLAPDRVPKKRAEIDTAEAAFRLKGIQMGEKMFEEAQKTMYGTGYTTNEIVRKAADEVLQGAAAKEAALQGMMTKRAVQKYKSRASEEEGYNARDLRTKDLASYQRK